ncbi:hypothetical protein [Parageobacillus galactosidasius]|uniref:Uncharacterized protein n=2 Tax=Anoxybacillaceae TaxID=3120669 RepID=A0A226QQ79_9BACL|nr:hypothetical protein [Parageobacillus galactosidasius]OXB94643.1 hypothetical protein B9L23_07150 [Parageobacillus galactosidasius]
MKANIILCLITIIMFSILTSCSRSQYFQNTKSTDLSNESFGGLRLHDNIYDASFLKLYGEQRELSQDNNLYNYYRPLPDLEIGTIIKGSRKGEIVRLIIGFEESQKKESKLHTAKGITIGSKKDDILRAYGKNYYKRSEQGVEIIGYVDRKQHATLEFWLDHKDRVFEIRLDDENVQ